MSLEKILATSASPSEVRGSLCPPTLSQGHSEALSPLASQPECSPALHVPGLASGTLVFVHVTDFVTLHLRHFNYHELRYIFILTPALFPLCLWNSGPFVI